MTKAQEVKKAIKQHLSVVSCTNGKGTAGGWVTLKLSYPKQEECYCNEREYTCRYCIDTKTEAKSRVYSILKQSDIKLYSYAVDDGYTSTRDCMIIDVELV